MSRKSKEAERGERESRREERKRVRVRKTFFDLLQMNSLKLYHSIWVHLLALGFPSTDLLQLQRDFQETARVRNSLFLAGVKLSEIKQEEKVRLVDNSWPAIEKIYVELMHSGTEPNKFDQRAYLEVVMHLVSIDKPSGRARRSYLVDQNGPKTDPPT